MSKDTNDSLSMPARWKALACSVAALLAIGFTATAPVSAQDASPEAAGECVAPDLPPGAPTDPSASPVAEDMAGMETEAEASPEAEDPGTAAEGEAADAILAAAQNLANCVNSGNAEGAVALMTENFLTSLFGTPNPYDAVEIMTGTTFGDFQASGATTYADGSVSADVQYWGSKYQLNGETWYFVQDGDYWKVDALELNTPDFDGDAAVVGINLNGPAEDGTYSIEPNTPAVVQPEVLVLHGINKGTEDHELLVFRLPEGADPMGLLDGSIPETDAEFIGQISVPVGVEGDMVLVGLEPGVYTLACFFTAAADGAPHAAHGMVAQFEVTAPA
jgi:hypothetical protein